MHKMKKLNIALIYGIIFLIAGIGLQAYKFSFTKSVYGKITGISNTECIISTNSGNRKFRVAEAIGDILSTDNTQDHTSYGKRYSFKYTVNNTEYSGETECTDGYATNDEIKLYYNKHNPNIVSTPKINSYLILLFLCAVIFIVIGFSSDFRKV